MNHRIFPLGDNALTIDFGNEISIDLNKLVLRLAAFFDRNAFEGFIEIVPAYASLTIFYDIFKARQNFPKFPTAFEAVKNIVEEGLDHLDEFEETNARLIEIPVCFEAEFAPDLEFVAAENKITLEKAVEIFLSGTYRVFMLGFLPGFSYMGEVAEEIAAPRKLSPRLKVPAGSVGIAGRQTGVYSLESPGGWQIIARTPLALFTPQDENPTVLRAGDSVKFYEIDKENFAELENQSLQTRK
jgi:inhibitor of KinA